MRRYRNTKIVATLGPSTRTKRQIRALVIAGVDVFRLNFSHGSHDDHRSSFITIRKLEEELDRPIAIMADLQGPKLRIGVFKDDEINLTVGDLFLLDLNEELGSKQRVQLPHQAIFDAAIPGMDLLLDDGKIRLRVQNATKSTIETKVIAGGALSNRKGVNVPGVALGLSALTEKDRIDLDFALDLGFDWIALSFVQRPADVLEARELIKDRASVLIKLEKPAAIEHLDELVKMADAVMVARGDLGVELPPEKVPGIQKKIVKLCRHWGKPVVVATQMLDSMVHSPAPTRAEASDVATAVYDSADAVMLSAETAAGNFPLESVEMMNRIILEVEGDDGYQAIIGESHEAPERTVSDAITFAARQVAETVSANCIITYTTSGSTTLRAARERPSVPILCVTSSIETARRLGMAWGVHSVHIAEEERFSAVVKRALDISKSQGFATSGDQIVITAGVPMGKPGSTNVLRIERVP